MKCRKCEESDAVFFVSWSSTLGPKIGFCDACAEEIGILPALRRVESLLHGFGADTGAGFAFEQAPFPVEFADECKACGTSLKEFERGFRFGCAECGVVFGSLIANYLTMLGCAPGDGSSFFRGGPPAGYLERLKIRKLHKSLEEKIENEDYALAAKQRDRLVELERRISLRREKRLAARPGVRAAVRNASPATVSKILDAPELPDNTENWLYSRIEVRRNFADFSFPARLDDSQLELVEKLAVSMLPKKWLEGCRRVNVSQQKPAQRLALAERFFRRRPAPGSAALLFPGAGRFAILNDTDHVVIGGKSDCRDPEKALAYVMKPVLNIERHSDVAFSPRFGFLTSAPKFIGTGLSVSVLLHLPFSFFRGSTFYWPDHADRDAVKVESFRGGNLEHHGFYLVSGLAGFGRSAEDIVQSVFRFAEKLVAEETSIRVDFKPQEIRRVKNLMPRVIHHATRSYRLSYQDVLRFASFFTIASSLEVIDWPAFNLNGVVPAMSSGFIMHRDGGTYSINQCEKRRADLFAELVDLRSFPTKK